MPQEKQQAPLRARTALRAAFGTTMTDIFRLQAYIIIKPFATRKNHNTKH
jgi:hypothetical protein